MIKLTSDELKKMLKSVAQTTRIMDGESIYTNFENVIYTIDYICTHAEAKDRTFVVEVEYIKGEHYPFTYNLRDWKLDPRFRRFVMPRAITVTGDIYNENNIAEKEMYTAFETESEILTPDKFVEAQTQILGTLGNSDPDFSTDLEAESAAISLATALECYCDPRNKGFIAGKDDDSYGTRLPVSFDKDWFAKTFSKMSVRGRLMPTEFWTKFRVCVVDTFSKMNGQSKSETTFESKNKSRQKNKPDKPNKGFPKGKGRSNPKSKMNSKTTKNSVNKSETATQQFEDTEKKTE